MLSTKTNVFKILYLLHYIFACLLFLQSNAFASQPTETKYTEVKIKEHQEIKSFLINALSNKNSKSDINDLSFQLTRTLQNSTNPSVRANAIYLSQLADFKRIREIVDSSTIDQISTRKELTKSDQLLTAALMLSINQILIAWNSKKIGKSLKNGTLEEVDLLYISTFMKNFFGGSRYSTWT